VIPAPINFGGTDATVQRNVFMPRIDGLADLAKTRDIHGGNTQNLFDAGLGLAMVK
jgi:hypothetical protein